MGLASESPDSSVAARRRPKRKSIAVLVDQLDHQIGGYGELLRAALNAECVRMGLDQYLFVGRALNSEDAKIRAHNGVYDLVGQSCVDGVVIAGGLSNHLGTGAVEQLCAKFRPLPICCIAIEIPGIPSIVAENRTAMANLVEHLVVEHRRSKIAFISGPHENPDVKLRRKVFEEVLKHHGIALHDELAEGGMFTPEGGEQAVYRLVGKATTFDAIVCANDAMALGALEALRALGYHVPRDVTLTGFDDIVQSRISSPALTTVRQPLDEMATLAVRTVYEQICGRSVPLRVELPCEFVPRKSCGCNSLAIARSIWPPSMIDCEPADFATGISERLVKLLEKAVRVHRNIYADWATPLVDSLVLELKGKKEAFLATLEELLDRRGVHNDIYEDFQQAITLLREELAAVLTPELEAMWHDARRLVAVANTRAHVRQRIELDNAYSRLLHSGEQFSTALNAESLKSNLAEELPRMDITNAYVNLSVKNCPQLLEPFFCLHGGRRLEVHASHFDACELLPPGTIFDDLRHNWFVLPMIFESEPLGVLVLEVGSGLTIYEMLREQIGTALKNIALHAEIVHKTALHERSMQERLATTDRMRSLSVLAGGVAHDLNNALGPLVALPDIIGDELETLLKSRNVDARDIKADLVVMKSASLRAARTIKDLLTLGRQGHAAKEILDVNVSIQNWFDNESPNRTATRGIEITLELAPRPLIVHASEPHVVRAVANLVRNAIEAVNGAGRISINTYHQILPKGASGFEPIDPGDYVVVAVTDNGMGIARDDLSRVFEPFFSKKKLDDTSGSGLGLAIVHGVVKEHGGFVDVRSVVGRGTEFLLYFRRAHEAVKKPILVSLNSVPSARILVVDDDPVQLRTASRVLERLGHSVTAMNSGAKALSVLAGVKGEMDESARQSFDVVVMDMLLNEVDDGLTILQKMQKYCPFLRGIIVSGHSPTERARLAVNGGLTWLSKPYTAEALARSVKGVLESLSLPPDED